MKLHSLLYITALASLALTACDEDYTDWAAPQQNAQPGALEQGLKISALATDVDYETFAADSIDVAAIDGTLNDDDAVSVSLQKLLINGSAALPFKQNGNTIRVSKAQLDSTVRVAYFSRQHTVRPLQLSVEGTVKSTDRTSYYVSSNTSELNYTPAATPATEDKYYVVGDMCGWDVNNAIELTSKGDGKFAAKVDVPDNCYYKLFSASGLAAAQAGDWSKQLGCSENGDKSETGFVAWNEGAGDPGALCIGTGGTYEISIDAVNYTYSCKVPVQELYYTGSYSELNWGSGKWMPLTAVNSHDGEFWTVIYADADEQIKFAPQAGWGSDFAGDVITDHAGSGAKQEATNLKFANAGWYIIYVNAAEKSVDIYAPNLYMMGNCVGGWDANVEANKFSVPADRTSPFISPAFTAAGEMRMYASVDREGIDWWQMEFVPINGEIAMRGNGPDQERVRAELGQKVYLNFNSWTAEVK